MKAQTLLLVALLGATCSTPEPTDNASIALELGHQIAASCPLASPSDEDARAQCAAKLTALTLLGERMDEPFMWGGQRAGKGYRLDESDTTRFNAFVWRRMYLSLLMFTGEVRVESAGNFIVIHLPYQFRNQLDMGSYPYPFWHSKTKWDSWQLSPELVLVMEGGRLKGALRSAMRDETRPYFPRTWSGQWQWREGGKEMPYVSLYTYLFSRDNPHVANLDAAYRAMSTEMRSTACLVCHAPDNLAKTSTLEFFNYPNQALYSRHSIVMHLTHNTMPPKNDFGVPQGVDEPERLKLLELARAFEKTGDDALAWEGELRAWSPPPDAGAPRD